MGIYAEGEIEGGSGGFDLRPIAIVVTVVAVAALVSILVLRMRKRSDKQIFKPQHSDTKE